MSLTRKAAYDRLCRILAPAIPDTGRDLTPDAALWPLMFEVADANLVLPELRGALVEKALWTCSPQSMREGLDEVARLVQARNLQLLAQMREVNAALAAAGIRPVWLKGAVLLTEPNGQRGSRLMRDLDLWVPEPEEQTQALAILTGLGYAPKPTAMTLDWSESHHHAPLYHPERPVSMELHRHIVRTPFADLLPDAMAKERLVHAELDGLPMAHLALRDRIMHSLIQCSLMSNPPIASGQTRLMKVVDLAQLLARDGTHALPADVVDALAASSRHKELARFLTLLGRDFGIPNPLGTDPTYCDVVDQLLRHSGSRPGA